MKTILQLLEVSKLRNLILSANCFLGVGFAKKTNGLLCRIHAEKGQVFENRAHVSKTNAKLNKFPQIIKKAWPIFFKSRSSFFIEKTESAGKRFNWICLSSFFFVKSSQSCAVSRIVRRNWDCVPILAISLVIVIFYTLFMFFTNWRNAAFQNT